MLGFPYSTSPEERGGSIWGPPRLSLYEAFMLTDQYGRPIGKQLIAPQQQRGLGGGYKKVSGDGYGKSKYRDYDPKTGILREITFDGHGGFTTRRWQNVQAIADINQLWRETFKKNPNSGMQRQAVLPQAIHEDFMIKCGWKPGKGGDYDKKKMDQLLNDSDYAKFKSRDGKVSVQQTRWDERFNIRESVKAIVKKAAKEAKKLKPALEVGG